MARIHDCLMSLTAFDGRNPAPVQNPCKEWDKLPTSRGDRRISSTVTWIPGSRPLGNCFSQTKIIEVSSELLDLGCLHGNTQKIYSCMFYVYIYIHIFMCVSVIVFRMFSFLTLLKWSLIVPEPPTKSRHQSACTDQLSDVSQLVEIATLIMVMGTNHLGRSRNSQDKLCVY